MKKFFAGLSLLLILGLFPPVTASTAILKASPTTVYSTDEPIRFDGSGSDPSEGNIVRYYFDYGDNLSSGWIDSSVITYQYPQPGTYYARLKVKDSREDKYELESKWGTPPVTITVKGQSPVVNVTVPNVVGLNIDEAKEVLAQAGLQLGAVIEKDSDQSPGTVLDQDPKARTMVPVDTPVNLVVAAKGTERPLALGLVADPMEISTGGERSTIIITLLRGGNEVEAPSNTRVLLDTTLGKITPWVIIPEGETGGMAVLESPLKSGTAEITATSEGLISGYAEVEFISPPEERVVPPRRLVIESDVSSLPSDGESSTTITIILADDEGNLIIAEEDITVYLKATGGQVEPSLVTIREGEPFIAVTFISPAEPGTVRIFAASRGLKEVMIEVEIYLLLVEEPDYLEDLIALLLGVVAGTSVLIISRRGGYFKIEVKPRVGKQELSVDEEKPLFKKPRKIDEKSTETLEENTAFLFSDELLDSTVNKALENLQDRRRFRLANFLAGPNKINNDEIGKEIKEFFRVDICELLISIWKKARALQDFRDREKYPCENTYQLILLTREMRSKRDLSLDIRLNGVGILSIPFELNIVLTAEGFKMWIRCGRIVKVISGVLKGTVIIETGSVKVVEKNIGDMKIPGEASFGEGIEIPDMAFVSPP